MRSSHVRTVLLCVSGVLAALMSFAVLEAAMSLSTSTPSAQNFDGMGIPATATTASTLPADFRIDNPSTVRTVGSFSSAATTVARAGGPSLSSTAANGTYSFGAGTSTTPTVGGSDRAVGFLSSGTATASGNLYAQYANNTGGDLTGLKISYDVEKYRLGTNTAGFCIQLYYSSTGESGAWTSAGSPFLTTFAGDPSAGGNAGYTTAPGDTRSITNQTLTVTIPNGSNVYLAWNYSVCSGSTTTNGQALAIDNVSVLGVGGGGGNANLSVTGAATPSPVDPTGSTLLTATVTHTNPIQSVTADLRSIGGSQFQQLFDDGTQGDVTAGTASIHSRRRCRPGRLAAPSR